jgi:hypothetical protein
MKSRITAIVLLAIAANFANGDEPMARNDADRIRFSFADKEIIVALVDNSAARSLVAMLPLDLEFRDYAASEKISDLPRRLDSSDVPAGHDPAVGDLTLYAPWGNLAFFYRDHGYARGLVPLGSIVSGADVLGELDRAEAVRVDVLE